MMLVSGLIVIGNLNTYFLEGEKGGKSCNSKGSSQPNSQNRGDI